MNTERLAIIEDCLQVFLTDTSQYLVISGGASQEERNEFLRDFSEAQNFANMSTALVPISSTDDISRAVQENATKNISIFFFQVQSPLDFEEIRTVIEQKVIDSKIIFTNPEKIDSFFATNFVIPTTTRGAHQERNSEVFLQDAPAETDANQPIVNTEDTASESEEVHDMFTHVTEDA